MRIGVTFSVGLEQYAQKMQEELSAKGHAVSISSFNIVPADEELGRFIKDAEVYVAGAGLDVLSAEPPRSCELQRINNIVLTPHIGGSTALSNDSF